MSLIAIDWNPGRAYLRRFSLALCLISLITAIYCYFTAEYSFATVFFIATGCIVVLSMFRRAILPVYWLWMGIALFLGIIVAPVVLFAFYYLVITPLGVCRRLLGKEKLRIRKPLVDSYWLDLPKTDCTPERYQRQF